VITPNNPLASLFGPAVKKSSFGAPLAPAPFAEIQSPQLIDHDRPAVSIGEVSEEFSSGWIEGVDFAVFDLVGNQNGIAEWTEIRGPEQFERFAAMTAVVGGTAGFQPLIAPS
jgi:hypothetical protein